MNQPEQQPNRQIQSYIFGGILIVLFIFVLRLFSPFFTVLLWSIMLYIILHPLHRRVTRRLNFNTFKGKLLRNVWAGVFALGTMVIILLPLLFILFLFVKQIMELGYSIQAILVDRPDYIHNIFENIASIIKNMFGDLVEIDADTISHEIGSFIHSGISYAGSITTNIALNVGGFIISISLMLFTLFFLYVDGPYLSRLVLHAIPIKREYLSALSAKFLSITRNLFSGYIIVALLQSVLAYIIFASFGINGALVLAGLTFFMTFIPIIGAGILFLPMGFFMIAGGDTTTGVLFLVVCTVFLFGLDSILRPFFMRDRLNLHPLIIFFAILGGLSVFGFNGFILGPVIVILFLTVLDLFLIEHKIVSYEQKVAEEEKDTPK